MQNTSLATLAASLRVIGDELITMADALKADAAVAPLASSPQQQGTAPVQTYPQQGTAPVQTYPQQGAAPVQQQQGTAPVQQQQGTAPVQQQQGAAPGAGAPVIAGGMSAPPPTAGPIGVDAFNTFSNELIALSRQAGPSGLTPVIGRLLQRYGRPPTNDLPSVPEQAYGPFLEEVRAYVAQQSEGRQ